MVTRLRLVPGRVRVGVRVRARVRVRVRVSCTTSEDVVGLMSCVAAEECAPCNSPCCQLPSAWLGVGLGLG